MNGQLVKGAYDLVGTPHHPAAGMRNEHFTDFCPDLGIAYRLDAKTVLRAGLGTAFIPSTLKFPECSAQSPLAYLNGVPVFTQNNGITPDATLGNAFPNGLTPMPGRSSNYQMLLLGVTRNALSQDEENGYTYQWNLAVEREMPKGMAAYAGLQGVHLPVSRNRDQVPVCVFNQALADPACQPTVTAACFLQGSTANPLSKCSSTFIQGRQQYVTIPKFQLYRPLPQYPSISNVANYRECALSGYDSRQRLVVSYVYNLPIGPGQAFFSGVLVLPTSWCRLECQRRLHLPEGIPMGITMNFNLYAGTGVTRPDVVAGLDKRTQMAVCNV